MADSSSPSPVQPGVGVGAAAQGVSRSLPEGVQKRLEKSREAPTRGVLDPISSAEGEEIRKRVLAAAARDDRRRKVDQERFGDLPKVLNFPRRMMFPPRVLREPKDKDGSPLPLQNAWNGRDGLINYIIHGGVRPDGRPIGIPGHSFPLVMTMGVVTECKYPFDPCTLPADKDGRYIGLGNVRDASGPRGSYLPELARRMGWRANMRGEAHEWIDKDGRVKPSAPLLFIRRLEQYVWGEYRTVVCENEDSSKELFRLIRAEIETARKEGRPAVIAPVGDLGKYDSSLRISTDFKIWDKADLGYDNDASFRAYLRLTPEFLDSVVRHAVPVPTPLVTRLMRNAQDLALLPIVAGLVDRGEYVCPYVRSLQYQIGLNGLRENMRPDGTMASMRRIASAWNAFALEIEHPECQLVYDPIPSQGARGERLGFHPCENLANAWYRVIGYNQD